MLALLLITGSICAQRSTVLPVDSARESNATFFPLIFRTPLTGWQIALTGLYTYYTAPKDYNTRPSVFFLAAIYTQRKQQVYDSYINQWSKGNKYHIMAEIKYSNFNFLYYGIGDKTKKSDEIRISERYLDLSAALEKKIHPKVYIGADIAYRQESFLDLPQNPLLNKDLLQGLDGGKVPRLGASIIYDSRNTYTYCTAGQYFKFSYGHTLDFLNSSFSFHRFYFESRHFKTYKEKHTIGINTNVESIQGDLPFYELRQMGSPQIMRAYYPGRFRDQNYVAAQAEYRYRISPSFAAVAFGGLGTVFSNKYSSSVLMPNYGVGLRYFYDKASMISIRLDYSWGLKPYGEPRIKDYTFFIGEAF